MKPNVINVLVAVVGLLVVLSLSVFVVDQRQVAIVLQLGEMVRVETTPGLKWKVPLMQNVRYFDSRILTLESPDPAPVFTKEKKNLLVDAFVKWRIVDVKQYYISMGGDEVRLRTRLMPTVNASLSEEFSKRTIHEAISVERDKIMQVLREKADADARLFGVQVLDVRLKHVDFPASVSQSVYSRMEAERKRVANELRATGAAEGEKIKADAQKTKGEGDAKASATYAAAFGRNAEFYSFYRSLEAYKQSFKNKSDVMVLDPSSAFFKYLKSPAKSAK
jgi:membrane protease subunit HflC